MASVQGTPLSDQDQADLSRLYEPGNLKKLWREYAILTEPPHRPDQADARARRAPGSGTGADGALAIKADVDRAFKALARRSPVLALLVGLAHGVRACACPRCGEKIAADAILGPAVRFAARHPELRDLPDAGVESMARSLGWRRLEEGRAE